MAEAILDGIFEHDSLSKNALAAIVKQLRRNVWGISSAIDGRMSSQNSFKSIVVTVELK
jgi:hypothetical protein